MSSDEEGKGRIALLKRIGTKVVITAAKKATGYDVIEDIYDTVADELRNIYQGIKRDKIYNFYMGIEELSENEIELSSDNFAFLIQKLMEDDEVGKAKIYSRLVVNISNSNYEDEDRINFISILSKLSSYELELAKKYYIYGNYDLVGYEYQHNQLEILHEPTDGQLLRYTNGLVFNGLIYNPNNRASKKGYYQNTDTLNQFVQLIFDKSELKAESIGEVAKERYDILALENRFIRNESGELFTSLMIKKGFTVKIISQKEMDEYLYYGGGFVTGSYVNEINGSREIKKFILRFFHDYDALKAHKVDKSTSSVNKEIEVDREPTKSQINDYLTKFANNIETTKKYYDEQKSTST